MAKKRQRQFIINPSVVCDGRTAKFIQYFIISTLVVSSPSLRRSCAHFNIIEAAFGRKSSKFLRVSIALNYIKNMCYGASFQILIKTSFIYCKIPYSTTTPSKVLFKTT